MASTTKTAAGIGVTAAAALGALVLVNPSDCPRTSACLSWEPSTKYTDGTLIAHGQQVGYKVYRRVGTSGAALVGTLTDIAGPSLPRLKFEAKSQPAGVQRYYVTAMVNTVESDPSNTTEKLVRAPAPTEGSIEAPTDGSIESP